MTSLPVLDLDTVGWTAASRIVGADVGGQVERAWDVLRDGYPGMAAMAGVDPVGTAWAASYDEVAAAAAQANVDLVNGCARLATLLSRSGCNYGRAESASGGVALVDDDVYAGLGAIAPTPPSAAGGHYGEPPGWSVIAGAVDRVWPGGHQDRLRATAAVWTRSADLLAVVAHTVPAAVSSIEAQRVPELDRAVFWCRRLGAHITEVAAAHRALATSCSDYASAIDQAHSDIEHELLTLASQSATIQVVGGLLIPLTAGLSEIPTQALQAERIAAIAARVAAIIDRLAAVAADAARLVADLAARAVAVSRDLAELLRSRLAELDLREDTGAIGRSGARTNLSRFEAAARATWRDEGTLRDHFMRHRRDFGVPSESEYASRAHEFLLRATRGGLLMKYDRAQGTIRVFDPETNTFGAYTLEGKTRTFYKPTSPTFWDRQEGVER